MWNRGVFQGNAYHVLLGEITAFPNGLGNFDGFSQANAYAPMFVAGDHQRAKAEATSAFDDFRRAVDKNNFLAQLRTALGGLS